MVAVADVERIRGAEVWRLATEENRRLAAALAELDDEAWGRPTDCDRWTVADLARHVLGALEAQASPKELIHQFRRGLPLNRKIDSHHWVDGLNEIQVRERSDLSPGELVERIAAMGPKAVAGRRRTPWPVRSAPIPFGPPIGWQPLTYLLRVGFTRDFWMHRIDLSRAVGTTPELTPEHDGRLVADIVAEWAAVHGQPFRLELTGPAGGRFEQGATYETTTVDAVEFARILSGRAQGAGVLAHPLPL
ncbi:maleylpyruvate isomerase family mycothiol-dependent enzyme [Nonomuraea phyllanthi]|uniref:maleylpyruvate isomerase family mycothiol-dependent enzyme n=1 Tax=Nonomuraea phyllanthi TaxID=2219224 RepID=UPI0012934EB1|nr:maleylpyruvate isomerase family mycothiol-dependent enzyme [Nonomuraea phyllanthi]QFY13342.1 maleylpyruvate isomerase family mycothiol-dependent enzyme [Nonomuraea phyllanthi]